MVEHIQQLFVYDDWANREVMKTIRASGSGARAVKLMSHILSAERLWLERIKRVGQTLAVWPEFNLQQCEEQAAELRQLWDEFLRPADEAYLAVLVPYKNTKGESFNSQRKDILLHVITHSIHHRGQIAADVRAAGFTPAYTDFIHAVRQGYLE
jgi:uncharacterized damage-inducible protein DinB